MRLRIAIAISFLALTGCASSISDAIRLSALKDQRAIAPSDVAKWRSRFEAGAFRSSSGMILPYRIARPSVGSRRPLVLVLHGTGEIGTDNKRHLTPLAASWIRLQDDPENAPIVVAPQVPARSANYDLCNGLRCAARPGPSFPALLELMDSFAASDDVDPERVYLVGFSMGASTALQLALARPKTVAGVVAFSGVPPSNDRAPELKRENLLIVHGTRDTHNSFKVMSEWLDHLKAAGGNATLVIREDINHQVPRDMSVDANWRLELLAQRLESERS